MTSRRKNWRIRTGIATTKPATLRTTLAIFFAIVLPLTGSAQIVMTGVPHPAHQAPPHKGAGRTQEIVLTLPFFDDFSKTTTTYADTNLWFSGKSIRVNDGMAIRPPSLKVATFDGIDQGGKPYNVNDVLAKGYADELTSHPININAVAEAERNSIYLSYQYQWRGNGEPPDAGDRLLVSFLDTANAWIPVDTIDNDNGNFLPDQFYTSAVHVDKRFQHEKFQMRFQNFARLSGPYDTWHVDYIYMNKGRNPAATDFLSFPDRTIVEPLTSLFGTYRIMPIDHFILGGGVMVHPTTIGSNQRPGNDQAVNLTTTADITYWAGEDTVVVPTQSLEFNNQTNLILRRGEYTNVPTKVLPDLLTYAATADSILVNFKYGLNTRDNDPNFSQGPGDDIGDYVPAIFSPVDFRWSDTTRAVYVLSNKYAYDDGTAEYGAGLNQPGAQVAYQYDLVGATQEDITYLDLYFPRFGDETSQVLELRIWNDLASDPVYTEITTLQRSQDNVFWRKKLTAPVHVQNRFYVGWKQTAAAVIAIGLDKSTDTGDKMYYRITSDWIQNTTVHGNLMIRPVFGEGNSDPNGLEDEKTLAVYPNPGNGVFRFPGAADKIMVYDITGRIIPFTSESTTDETILTLPNASQGIYIIRSYAGGKVRTAKVMVR